MLLDKYKPLVVQEKIDGIPYTSTKLPTSVGLTLLPKITLALGERLTTAIIRAQAGQPSGFEGLEDVQISAAIRAVARQLDALEFAGLAKEILANVECGKLRPVGGEGRVVEHFDEHFVGEYIHLFQVMGFAIVHNFLGPTLGSLSLSGSLGTQKDGPATTEESSP